MKPEIYSAKLLTKFFRAKKIATLDELKEALGTPVSMTVFRKLKELSYYSSYSNGGKYYTLIDIPKFDEFGLWAHKSVWFSKHGTLLATATACIDSSEAGYYSNDLSEILHVSAKEAVLKLFQGGLISREKFNGKYLYCSANASVRKKQLQARKIYESNIKPGSMAISNKASGLSNELKANIVLFFCSLNEQQRRLYAGLESLKLGHGGDVKIAELLGMDVSTVARGRKEIMEQDVDNERVRKVGGGRPSVEKKHLKSSKQFENY